MAVQHYENFPVASLLCPAHLRPAITAIYHFARCADDLADEGDASAEQRLADLSRYRTDLTAITQNKLPSAEWLSVFSALEPILHNYQLPQKLLADLLNAFEQDIRYTCEQRRYADDAELLDYCTRSANPVGRLLLHLYGMGDELSLTQSDQICSALQLINFWQDVQIDVARARWYPSLQTMQRFGVVDSDLQTDKDSLNASLLIAYYANTARAMMIKGAPLACRIPGRAGWELRLVVQGGLRILDKIEALKHATWRQRPKITMIDLPLLLWRAWRMG
jgi:squalene synthase HpnC